MKSDLQEFARVGAAMAADPNAVFVFGSNRRGVHGAGAARAAFDLYGAAWFRGEGPHGRSYAIPTKDERIETLPIERVAEHVHDFLVYARALPAVTFVVTRIGCGFAGFTDAQIAPLFADAPANCQLPDGWRA